MSIGPPLDRARRWAWRGWYLACLGGLVVYVLGGGR